MTGSSYFGELLQTIAERGRRFLPFNPREQGRSLEAMCESLLSGSGEASGMAIATAILERWSELDPAGQLEFLVMLLERFGPDGSALDRAIDTYLSDRSPASLLALHRAAEPRRQELIRRLNLAPNGVRMLVAMRATLLGLLRSRPNLEAVDADFTHLFVSWFNRGFLVLRPINWATPANILEKIIRYEAVHEIGSWEELRRRLAPEDRRCFAFFHPRLVDEPLIFVEVALTRAIPAGIAELLDEDRDPIAAGDATTAAFYSISNCQQGLRGISFGSFLIKQVVADLSQELPNLKHFVTLSPVRGFASWLAGALADPDGAALGPGERAALAPLAAADWAGDAATEEALRQPVLEAAAWYFLNARDKQGRPLDPVARFHLGNGARLERINFLADRSPGAMQEAHGVMVNYLYVLADIEAHHEAFAARGEVAVAPAVRKLLRRPRSAPPAPLAAPAATAGTAP
jgi:malonyl-CoA decarboxylase